MDAQDVANLVREVLATIQEPYSNDITEDVFLAIERQPDWEKRYFNLVGQSSSRTVNQSIGRYTKEFTGRRSGPQVPATRSRLIKSFTKLLA